VDLDGPIISVDGSKNVEVGGTALAGVVTGDHVLRKYEDRLEGIQDDDDGDDDDGSALGAKGGKPKRDQKSPYWCWTLNIAKCKKEGYPYDPKDWLPKNVRYSIYQLEKGESGTEHYQGYTVFSGQKRLSWCKKVHRYVHWERRQGTHLQAKEYCKKLDTAVGTPVEVGDDSHLLNPEPGKRNDLIEVKNVIDEDMASGKNPLERLYEGNFKQMMMYGRGFKEYMFFKTAKRSWMPEVYVYYGEPGSNKSRRAWNGVIDSAYSKDPGTKWWDGYMGQETVIVDDYRGAWHLEYLLTLCDRYPVNLEVKGGYVQPIFKKIIFTANEHPKDWNNMNMMFYLDWDLHPFKRRLTQLIECKKTDLFE